MIEFRVLGPIEVLRDGDNVSLGGPRQQALLALLLLESGRPISADRLADELWQGEPPDGAARTVPAYVSKLRSVLGADVPITSTIAGYSLLVPPDRLDSLRFERLAAEGREALARGAARRAAGRLRSALALWRGPPIAGLADDGALRAEAERLDELRLSAIEDRIEADLALGKAAELLEELEGLVGAHPYRERLWRQLMLALYRSERQSDALAAYRRARSLLDEELGLEPSVELQRLEQSILRHEVPAAQPPEERHNLPAPISSFVGRDKELADIERLLSEGRLLTLSGVGGVGKTRLALEAAAKAVPESVDGVYLVDLSALSEPALVARQIAGVLEIRELPGSPFAELLAAQLRDLDLLLVLDNCEHLLEASAELCQRLLNACPRLRILATSREALGVPGEIDYPVQPLLLPSPGADLDEVRASEAVRLFLARANESHPLQTVSGEALSTAAQICRDLDGLPLAIELAAARVKAFSFDEIASRLADRFQFLVSWRRLTPARHRTLTAAIDWSYELLSEAERELFDRLSVFAGAFSLAAAAAVCLDGDDDSAVDLIEHLVNASLVVAIERDGEMRFLFLETVRQFAAERLGEREATVDLRRRHAEHFLAVAEAATVGLQRSDVRYLERLGRDPDNLRAAHAWIRDEGEAEHQLRFAKALWWFWFVKGELSESRAWLDSALESGKAGDPGLRAHVLEGAAGLAWAQGDLGRAWELAEAALPLFAQVGDRRGEAACTNTLGLVALSREDFGTAETLFERYRELAGELGDELGGRQAVARAIDNLGSVALDQGDLVQATERYEAARQLNRDEGDREGVAFDELHLSLVAIEAGRYDDAAALLGGALRVYREVGFARYAAECLEGIAAVARARGDATGAAQLLGAAVQMRERTGNPAGGTGARIREREMAATRAELGEPDFAAALAEGRALREGQAIEQAQGIVRG